jgi:serine/threonine protein kinase
LKEEVPMAGKDGMSLELRDFLLKCLCKDPYKRMPAEALLAHPFISKVETPVPFTLGLNRLSSTQTYTQPQPECFPDCEMVFELLRPIEI